MVRYSKYGGVMKNTGKKLKKYAALALALSILSPMAAFASEQEAADKDTVLTETKLEANPYQKSVTMTLSEDGKKINYDINIEKDQENLTAYIYQFDQSNITNLSLEGEKATDQTLGKVIKVDLKDKTDIKLTADIIEGKISNLSFDLVLVDDKDYKDHTHIDAKLSKNGDKVEVQEVKTDSQNLGLRGQFTDSQTIAWSDIMVNKANDPIKTDYELSVSANQSVEDQKLTLDFYELTNEGYKKTESDTFDLGSIKDLTISPHSLVKISFDTKALSSKEAYQINDAIVTKDISSNDKEVKDTDKSKEETAKDYTEKLNGTINDIQTTLVENENNQVSDEKAKDEPTTQVANLKKVKTISLEDTSKDSSKEENAKEFTAKINNISSEIQSILIENEKSLPDTIMNEAKSEPASSKEVTAKELTERLQNIKKDIEETLKSVVSADQYNKLVPTKDPSKEEQAQALIKTLNKQTSQILEVLRQVELGEEADYLDENPEELAKIEKLLADIEKFDENTKKVIKANQEKNKDYVSPHFEIVKEYFSKEVYKKLEKVVTITLDPMSKPQTIMTKEEIKKEYPSIAHYLENLELRSDLLNSLK